MHCTAVLVHAAVPALPLTALRYSATEATVLRRYSAPATVLQRYSSAAVPPSPSAVQCSVLLQCSALLANGNSATVQQMT